MSPHRARRTGLCRAVFWVAGLAAFTTACDTIQPVIAGGLFPGLVVVGAGGADLTATAKMVLPETGEALAEGTISSPDDVVVFSLGAVRPGDRLTIDVTGANGLNTVAALFNSAGELMDANDDRSYYLNLVDPFISIVIREHDSDSRVAVAIARGRFFSSTAGRRDSGSFRLRVTRAMGATFVVNPQVVWLEFGGGSQVRIAQEPAIDVRPFDVGRIVGPLASSSEYIKDLVVAKMREDLAPFNATVLRSDRDARPAGDYTTIYFGGYDSRFLGLADNVDSFNTNPKQKAVIFTETLSLFTSLRPSAEELAQAIANVAAHELGHLLGLEHAADPQDLMAEAATAQQIFYLDAVYMTSALDTDLFPVGVQNSVRQLALALGWSGGAPVGGSETDETARLKALLEHQPESAPVQAVGPAGLALPRLCNHRH